MTFFFNFIQALVLNGDRSFKDYQPLCKSHLSVSAPPEVNYS